MICEICNDGKDYKNLAVHTKMKHDSAVSEKGIPPVSAMTDAPVQASPLDTSAILNGILSVVQKLDQRLTDIEVRGGLRRDDSFKAGVLDVDRKNADVSRTGVDERITKIVDELLVEPFERAAEGQRLPEGKVPRDLLPAVPGVHLLA